MSEVKKLPASEMVLATLFGKLAVHVGNGDYTLLKMNTNGDKGFMRLTIHKWDKTGDNWKCLDPDLVLEMNCKIIPIALLRSEPTKKSEDIQPPSLEPETKATKPKSKKTKTKNTK